MFDIAGASEFFLGFICNCLSYFTTAKISFTSMFDIMVQSCYFDYAINKPSPCSRCFICVSCSLYLDSSYSVRKGSWAYSQINAGGKSDHMV